MHVVTIEVPSLGNRCHLVHDGRSALVVDPPRDLAPVERAAEAAEVEIVAVADTHVHSDYVSGALALARRHGADYLLAADERVDFERVGVRDGDEVPVGRLRVEVHATPGHTRHHQAFLVREGMRPAALFTGGSLLHGTVGRTDLVDPRLTRELARQQWRSARALSRLHPATTLHPTHGFGSLCAATSVPAHDPGRAITLADQLTANPALTTPQEAFVSALVAGFGPVPAHYRHVAPLNRAGAGRAHPRPARPRTAEEVADTVLAGGWVVDLRERSRFAEAHLPGSVSIEAGPQMATYVGWLVPWGTDIVLVTDDASALGPALRDLAAIGIEGVGTHVLDGAGLTATYRRTDWAGYRAATAHDPAPPRVVLDVRQREEWAAGHLPGAVHVPVQDVAAHAATLPAGEVWVHCRSGYRAGIAASLLHRLGHHVVHVDDAWERVHELAIPVAGLAA
ncbi:rhodanese-like domain-containing protein [Nocardioides marmotae]|uniref:rhodanese-like domain-containing protein n=1 Tax=Nocardioides marmotae TaxID=2663857 RepID=UPI0012B5AD21|nr:rhodanese-like domain-containing protein [Nocardioides marmotae]MBC9732244.1 MBL fold metallo-hydrolase [Nocardioides marmotae]MTB83366.1 MBL fold metallo-hydrolase [Nocardioides marmotae]